MNYGECYEKGKRALAEAGIQESELDARLLLEYVCGTNRNDLLVHGDRKMRSEQEDAYLTMIGMRAQRIPLQHLTGVQDFMGLEFQVDSRVLIPRQDTEILVEEALRELRDGMDILDMCTGSGCILISLLRYSNDCTGLGVDISPEALTVAKENARKLLAPDKQVRFLESDLFGAVEGIYDMIVSNPPYIPSGDIGALMPEVKDHEPVGALDGREDGLYFYHKITEGCRKYLKPGGMLFYEIGCGQGTAVSEILSRNGFGEIRVIKDYAGLDRVVSGVLRHM
ncbi:MAG: peptide chain release factor N(5)-glutamine methyltransferase [Eubacterium sp.]|nr:peptide chain release factor N(5)-glutamine methyltransferase [Eubacterium sp.]MCM1216061.1 peptide chain release factor N(5)-glutamine methyltransferase [Lachnospiraceae bacterium]MCM1239830.1 peptide chain release factor N(5)-glutamine methyltransferase [Lachnospiraceae bacterium]